LKLSRGERRSIDTLSYIHSPIYTLLYSSSSAKVPILWERPKRIGAILLQTRNSIPQGKTQQHTARNDATAYGNAKMQQRTAMPLIVCKTSSQTPHVRMRRHDT